MSEANGNAGSLSLDGAAEAMAAARAVGEPVTEQAKPDYVRPEDEDDKPEQADVEAAGEAAEDDAEPAAAEEEVEQEPEQEPLPAPRSWSKADQEAWGKLPRDVQEIVARREADRDKAANQASAIAGQVNAQIRALSDKYDALAAGLKNDWQHKWGNVDWVRAARELSPEEFNAARAEAEQDLANWRAAEAERERVAKAARQSFLAEEWQKLTELSPELSDPEKGGERRAKTADYLVQQGIEPELIGELSARELTIAYKAMLYDAAQAEAKRKAALPKKVTPQTPAKPVKPTGGAAVSPTRELQGLEARLTKAGRGGASLNDQYDIAAQLMASRREQQQRRSSR